MLSPSDFNNAVPQFTNGNYASNPINPQYIAEPDAESYNRGTEPLQTLPAQWWNWFVNKFTARFNKVNIYVKNIFNELAQVLSIFNITPDGTEQTPTTSQLKTVFETCYPQYVKTQTTGTAVGCIPTVGTALGTTNNNILVTDSTGKLKPSGITVGTAAGCDATLFARKTEVDALYGNVAGTALGTAAVGTCTTFARSDHVHPVTGLATTCVDSTNWPGIGVAGGYSTFIRTTECGFIPYCIDTINGSGYLGVDGWPFKEVHAKNFYGTFNGNATSSSTIYVNSYSDNYNFDIALTNSNEGGNQPLFASRGCPLNFNTSTGVLTAACFNGNANTATWAVQATGPIPFDAAEEARPLGTCVRAVVTKGITEGVGYRSRMAIGLMYCGTWAHGLISVGCTDDGTGWDNFIFPVTHGGTVVTSTTIGCYTAGNAERLKIDAAGYSAWTWSGQNGQPSWLWGSNDGVNMFIWNPANFNVNYAKCACYACCASSVNAFEVNGWIARCEFQTGCYCYAYNPNGYPILALIPIGNGGGCQACVIPAGSCVYAVTASTSGAGIVLRT